MFDLYHDYRLYYGHHHYREHHHYPCKMVNIYIEGSDARIGGTSTRAVGQR